MAARGATEHGDRRDPTRLIRHECCEACRASWRRDADALTHRTDGATKIGTFDGHTVP